MAKAPAKVEEETPKPFEFSVPSHGQMNVEHKDYKPVNTAPMLGAGFTTEVKRGEGVAHEIVVNYNNK